MPDATTYYLVLRQLIGMMRRDSLIHSEPAQLGDTKALPIPNTAVNYHLMEPPAAYWPTMP